MSLLCKTFSNAFHISKKTPLTCSLSSKELMNSWVMQSWLIQESSGLKLDWLEEINLLPVEGTNKLL